MTTRRRLKVLQIITGLGVGGAERLVLDMMGEFNATEFDVRLATLADDLTALEAFNHTNVAVEVFSLQGREKFKAFHKMRHFMNGFEPDVIHAHMFHSLAVTTMLSTVVRKRPAICFTSHCFDEAFQLMRASFVRATRARRSADIIFQEDQHARMNAAKTVVIKNGVVVPEATPARSNWHGAVLVRLIAVGRLAEQKDPLGLIRSVAALGDPRVHLDFYGDGPLREQCRALIGELALESRIRLHGVTSSIRSEMQKADIFVMHSKFEGMPIAVLEAGAEAMPVVSTPVGAVPSLLEGGRGVLAESASFTSALAEIISTPDAAIGMGHRFYQHVRQHHSISAIARQHEALYQAVCQERSFFAGSSAHHSEFSAS